MSVAEAITRGIAAAVRVMVIVMGVVMPYFLQAGVIVRVRILMSTWVSMPLRIGVRMRVAYVLDIFRADADASDSLTKTPCHNVYKMVDYKHLPAYDG